VTTGVRRVDVLGVGVHALRRQDLLDQVEAWMEDAAARRPDGQVRRTVAYANAHVLNTARGDARLRDFLNAADLCYCDGNGVRLAASLLGDELPERMTGADWIWDLAWRAERRWRLYWIGGEPGVTAAASHQLLERHPRLQIETDHGFHERVGPEDDKCIARINAFRPDLVLVGMGTPLQEQWVEERRARIDAPVVWCLGATADFIAGKVRRGPAWAVEHAEWLTRFLVEPQRLAGRYLVGNATFLAAIAAQRARAGSRTR
jgi:N-acetylglucosaminyldiphosphoundecaprenol N-acetyl-beta-D-mannosaminyltransferase